MSMNKIISFLVLFFFSFFLFTNQTFADVSCEAQTNQTACGLYGKCKWNASSNTCTEQYVADEPCSENSIKLMLRLFGFLLLMARVAVPLIIITLATFDLFKASVDKDEKLMGKQFKILGIRIATGIFIFLIPTVLHALFKISDKFEIINGKKYNSCENCLLKPFECSVEGVVSTPPSIKTTTTTPTYSTTTSNRVSGDGGQSSVDGGSGYSGGGTGGGSR